MTRSKRRADKKADESWEGVTQGNLTFLEIYMPDGEKPRAITEP